MSDNDKFTPPPAKAGRPTDWPSKIIAPALAIRFYELLAELADDPAFDICHVFTGATNRGTPVIRWEGRVKSLPSIASAFLSLDISRKKCDTIGCCNPLHYEKANSAVVFKSSETEPIFTPQIQAASGEDYAEIVTYEIDKQNLKYKQPYQFQDFRPHIHTDDLTDPALIMALEFLNQQE